MNDQNQLVCLFIWTFSRFEQKQKKKKYSKQTQIFTYGFKYVNENNQLEKFKAPRLQPTKDFEPKFHIDLVLVKEVNWPLSMCDVSPDPFFLTISRIMSKLTFHTIVILI